MSWKGLVAAERTQWEPESSGSQSKHHWPAPQSALVEQESPTWIQPLKKTEINPLREGKKKLPDGLVPHVRRFTYIGSRSFQEAEREEEEEEGRRRERSRPNRRRCTEGAAHVPLLVRPTPTTFL